MTTKTKSPKVAAQTSRSAPAAGTKPKPAPAPESAASVRLRKEARAAAAAILAQIESSPGGENGTAAQGHNEQGGQQPAQPAPEERKQEVPDPARKGSKGDKKGVAPAKIAPANAPKPVKPVTPAKPVTPKRLSCIDAAAQIIGKDAIGCKDLIAEMGQRKLWSSPGGKTPDASLYAAITREIAAKGSAARFKKVDRGLFIAGPGHAGR